MEISKPIVKFDIKETVEVNGSPVEFTDCLIYPLDAIPTESEIAQEAQSRADTFVERAENPPIIEEE